jgi:hypothetical protein
MKRLTRRLLNGAADCAYCTYEFGDNGLCKNSCSLRRQQLERLAAYEDAEDQGLLVQLPSLVDARGQGPTKGGGEREDWSSGRGQQDSEPSADDDGLY